MPILFFISGIGTVFVLNRFNASHYIKQRTKRLLVPIFFGMLVVVPPQIYFERSFSGVSYTSFFDFFPSIFTTGPYPKGNLSWHHLWFIVYLFVYSLLFIPLYWFFNSELGKKIVELVANIPKAFGLYSLGLLLYIASFLYFWFPEETHALVNDWAGFTRYFLFFVFGGFIGTNITFWSTIENNRKLHLKLAFFSILLINVLRWNDIEPEWDWNLPNVLYLLLKVYNTWFWVLAILGYGKKYLNIKTKCLDYANEAIYPFYILHQTFIVMITYYVVQVTNESILNKYVFITCVSFVLTMGVYELLIKPYNSIRLLFGMKAK